MTSFFAESKAVTLDFGWVQGDTTRAGRHTVIDRRGWPYSSSLAIRSKHGADGCARNYVPIPQAGGTCWEGRESVPEKPV